MKSKEVNKPFSIGVNENLYSYYPISLIFAFVGKQRKNKVSQVEVINSLYKIICTTTQPQKDQKIEDNSYFKRRVGGFKAEMEFENEVKTKTNCHFLSGGMVLSPELNGTKNMINEFTYLTIDSIPPINYEEIYKKIMNWSEIKFFYYAQINFENWEFEEFYIKQKQGAKEKIKTQILKPNYTLYRFETHSKQFENSKDNNFSEILNIGRSKEGTIRTFNLRERERFDYFKDYELKTLQKIYVNRYFLMKKYFSVVCNIMDIDGYIIQDKKITIVEIKEKSPSKDKKCPDNKQLWYYGWDTRRLLWYEFIQKKIGLKILYTIRQTNNRKEKEFIKWDSIFLDNFLKVVSWHKSISAGGGESTLSAPYNHFKSLNEVLSNLD